MFTHCMIQIELWVFNAWLHFLFHLCIQDEEDEEEGDEKEGGLSNSGKELKKLLGRTTGLNESDVDVEDDDDDEDVSFYDC